ncbi:MAG: tungstate ABC transporter substrate-binding protein WtpA [Bacteroidota bacterium]|nr:tungstate ABC transporter substrate-binding protein WtpA [Bacteroidota bacterium]
MKKVSQLSITKIFLTIIILSITFYGCNNPKEEEEEEKSEISGKLIIFHAGSLAVPFKLIKEEFEKEYPDVDVLLEAAGSVTCARKITDLKRDCDIMASADYAVIDKFLIPDYSSWNIKFASNEMCIAFTNKSTFADSINGNNCFDVLLKDDVIYGRSDPNSDPCGYRSLLTIKLAEKFYNKKMLANFLAKDNNFIRPKETDLISLLETNNIDYIFIYRSVAKQHSLNFITLPDSINLKSSELAKYYSTVDVEIVGKKPGEKIKMQGKPMVYGLTILENAPNKVTANAFLDFLLSKEKGMKIMEEMGQPSVVPATTNTYQNVPKEFKKYVKE